MRLETIDRGITLTRQDEVHVARALRAALDQYMEAISLVRVRLLKAGADVRCKMRAWCGPGPTIVVASVRPTIGEAVDAAVATLQRAVRRRKGHAVAARRKGTRRAKLVDEKGA